MQFFALLVVHKEHSIRYSAEDDYNALQEYLPANFLVINEYEDNADDDYNHRDDYGNHGHETEPEESTVLLNDDLSSVLADLRLLVIFLLLREGRLRRRALLIHFLSRFH